MLGVGDVTNRLAAMFDAIARCTVGVVERSRAYAHPIADLEFIAGVEILELQFRFHGFERNWKGWGGHLPRDDLAQSAMVLQMPGHQKIFVVRVEGGGEKRKPRDVVPMRVTEEDRGFLHAL